MQQKTLSRWGDVLFYIGGAVWVLYAALKYILEWDVSIRQFLPYHLAAIIPGVLMRRCSGYFARKFGLEADTAV
ncbi:MAG: hypothetical protein GJV46_02210 [Geobacter sp.]|nr:hypothetical protein [Geobacter sp.]